MLFKSTLALAFVALANIASSASTPACVLSVVGDTSNPDDLSAICSSKTIQSTIESKCGDNADTALNFFSNTCKSNGFTVAEAESSNTTSSATETASGFATAVSTSGSSCHTKSGCASSATSTSGSASGAASGAASGSPSGTTSGGTGSSSSSGAGEASASPSFAGAITGQQLSGTTFAAALFFAAAAFL
ncbi:Period circadian protein [Penicillium malachiteum]|nr:Period circadian protein [Penicillium malachiteum]